MKAHVSKSGAAVVWAGALPSSWDGWFLDITETDPPNISAGEWLGRGPLEVEWADGVPVSVRTTWTVRPKTDEEAQTVSTQLSLYSRLSAAERRSLRTLANTDSPVGDVALQVEGALFAAVETESRNPQTKMLIGAVMQLGVVADIARARELLNDPGFALG